MKCFAEPRTAPPQPSREPSSTPGREFLQQGLGSVPEFHAQFDTRATAITVREDEHARIQPLLFTRDAIEAEAAKLR